MPITEQQAKSICDEVVAFFRTVGSTNQVYTKAALQKENEFIKDARWELNYQLRDQQGVDWAPKGQGGAEEQARDTITELLSEFLSEKEYRNDGARNARGFLEATRTRRSGKTCIEYGQIVHGAGMMAGNCMENACLAAFLASEKAVPVAEIFLLAAPGTADHGMCYIGPRPAFASIGAAADISTGWIIDPWAGIFAPPDKYAQTIQEIAQEWQRDGLRFGQVGYRERTWQDPTTWVGELIEAKLVVYDSTTKLA